MRRLLSLIAFGLAAILVPMPAGAQSEIEAANIAKMDYKQLTELVAAIGASVGQDTLKLEPAAKRGDCPELARASNSFALGYQMLGTADDTLDGKPARDALPVKARIVQSRVIVFAARVRAEEWVSRVCASYAVPAEHAGEPRYAKPAKLQTAEFTQAVIEARQVAEANLAAAANAGIAKSCPQAIGAMQSIELFVPYLEKLARDVAKRPEALGPKASKRGLEAARGQLIDLAFDLVAGAVVPHRERGLGVGGRGHQQRGERRSEQ